MSGRWHPCTSCGGCSFAPHRPPVACDYCDGSGRRWREDPREAGRELVCGHRAGPYTTATSDACGGCGGRRVEILSGDPERAAAQLREHLELLVADLDYALDQLSDAGDDAALRALLVTMVGRRRALVEHARLRIARLALDARQEAAE